MSAGVRFYLHNAQTVAPQNLNRRPGNRLFLCQTGNKNIMRPVKIILDHQSQIGYHNQPAIFRRTVFLIKYTFENNNKNTFILTDIRLQIQRRIIDFRRIFSVQRNFFGKHLSHIVFVKTVADKLRTGELPFGLSYQII